MNIRLIGREGGREGVKKQIAIQKRGEWNGRDETNTHLLILIMPHLQGIIKPPSPAPTPVSHAKLRGEFPSQPVTHFIHLATPCYPCVRCIENLPFDGNFPPAFRVTPQLTEPSYPPFLSDRELPRPLGLKPLVAD